MKFLEISVVIPCFNSLDTLKRTLESVLSQSYLPSEIIIIDDGSEVPINSHINGWNLNFNIPVIILTQKNSGAPVARNLGLERSVSKYVAFIDSDDIWFPNKLKIQYDFMEAYNLIMSGHLYIYNVDKILIKDYSVYNNKFNSIIISKMHFIFGNPFHTPTVMIRRDSFTGFDERFRCVDDYKAWLENFRPGLCGRIELKLAAGFKPPIGYSGLTKSVNNMHFSYLSVLKSLLNESKISFLFYFFAIAIEYMKFPIRKLRVQFNILFNSSL